MEIKFHKTFGPGKEPWYVKYERWASKQRFPISFLAQALIEWLKEKWIEGKVDMEMTNVVVSMVFNAEKTLSCTILYCFAISICNVGIMIINS